MSYDIRKSDVDIDYLGMDDLAFTVEGKKANAGENSLTLDAIEYAPVRNVVGHTGLLTDNGKSLLRLKHENIKARIKTLVLKNPPKGKKGSAKKRSDHISKLPISEMVDPLRSRIMSAVRSKNSSAELRVRSACHRLGFRFRLHRRGLPGTPDLVFPRLGKVIFVHGCFWHRHNCPKATTPKTRQQFWNDKFARNLLRDKKSLRSLKALGWEPLVVWECETKDRPSLSKRLRRFLSST